ncbi:hypothetical protein DJ71_02310 [Halorubrum sp. E3]|nr:hypothetical protein DJ71_02310 [Halorubrum sp. E3]
MRLKPTAIYSTNSARSCVMGMTDDTEDAECPTCGRDDFASQRGMKTHHKKAHGESIAQTELTCERCGCEFVLPDSQADGRRFCSRDCMADWRSEQTGEDSPSYRGGKTEVTCERCGEEFKVYPNRAEEAQYCSDECQYNGGPVQKTCNYCGSGFTVSPCREETAKYCSKDCFRDMQSEKRETHSCSWCGDDFTRPPGGDNPNNFCSRECTDAWKSANGTEIRDCIHCGEEFTAFQSETKEYCSRECASTARRKERVFIRCEHCGDEFEAPPWDKEDRRFCSKECNLERLKNTTGKEHPDWVDRLIKDCEQCGGQFKTLPSADHRFCSPQCGYKWYSDKFTEDQHPNWKGGGATITCEVCSKEFHVNPHRENEARFCSQVCFGRWYAENLTGEDHPAYKGGYENYYGPNWDDQSRKVRRRDQHRCQDCGMTEPEHLAKHGRKHPVHHITPIREFRDDGDLDHEAANDLDNLIVLCDGCHPKWDQVAPLRLDTTSAPADD